ncbi:MAG: RNA helicase [Rickettsiales bacterium]|nr:RNA helicase [Rickettsiales bacterium]|tara:strand:- start:1048 stop:2280 length:1233 start_codon:yes stop_codon:yes gene_type:complete
MKFSQFTLNKKLLSAINDMGYVNPTPIQEKAIPIALQGKDVLGLAQTGTGKTASFMLPILEKLSKGSLRKVRALVIAPTRELAEQIHQSAISLAKHMPIQSLSIYGGVSKYGQVKNLKKGVEIIIACPGRLLDLIGDGIINLSKVEILVLDEADTMCDMGFLPDVRRIMRYLSKDIQILFFAATMPDEIKQLTEDILHNPHTVQIGKIEPAKTVAHYLYPIKSVSLKTNLLLEFFKITATGKVIVFTRTKHRAKRLWNDLESAKLNATLLQGNMSQNRRQQSINGFKKGKYDILVATDMASRGIDISEVSHVINFDMPSTTDDYIHRIGRTGRAENRGEAITFLLPQDKKLLLKIESLLGYKIPEQYIDGFDYDTIITTNKKVTFNRDSTKVNNNYRKANRKFQYKKTTN